MSPNNNKGDASPTERPEIEETIWDALQGAPSSPAGVPETVDFGDLEEEQPFEAAEEDDDNAYNESDAALPDREGEKAIEKNPSKEGGLFDEV